MHASENIAIVHIKEVRAKIFYIDFFLKILPLKDDDVRNVKKMGDHRLRFGESLWREMFSANYGLSGPIKRTYLTGEVP